MAGKASIGILEDHPAVTAGYKAQIKKSRHLKVAWTSRYYDEVGKNLEKHSTDVLILDASVDTAPDNPNTYPILHAIPELLENYPEMVIIVISMHNRPAFIRAIFKSGASGYVLKDDVYANENLNKILLAVAEGEIYYSAEAEKVISEKSKGEPILTQRQIEILSYFSSSPHLTTKDLAEELELAHSTIRNHLSEIYFRLKVRKITSALAKARQLGLITPEKQKI